MEKWLRNTIGAMIVVGGLGSCLEGTARIPTEKANKKQECLTTIVCKQTDDKKTEESKKKGDGYQFTIQKQIETTPVKDQYRSGTCWSFSGISFLETELMRRGEGEFDLSEMFIVRYAYAEKAEKYVRMHGKINFAGGGLFHDVINVIREHGIVPEEVYDGKVIGEDKHIHGEMGTILRAYVDGVIENKNRKLTPVWLKGFKGVLDAYLGEIPETFSYKGKRFTPKSFSQDLGLNPDDYVTVTSYTHHPFYERFILELPDNWAWGQAYNLPLNDVARILENAVDKGYSVVWGGDVSDRGFSSKNGIAVIPEEDLSKMSKEELQKFFDNGPVSEKEITQETRQRAFDNYSATDDHGVHLIGIAEDQNGTRYYMSKNSWGDEKGPYCGYLFVSESFILQKATGINLHKEAIPKDIAEKMGL